MIPEIVITCKNGKQFINSVSVQQYKRYTVLMAENDSDRIRDAMFLGKKIVQEMLGNRMSLDEIGEMEAAEFIAALKGIHTIMQYIVSENLLNVVEAEPVEQEESAFDEYDMEEGYEEEREDNLWRTCGKIVDQVVKIAIRLMRNSYSQCMEADILLLLDYLKFELDTIGEDQG